MDSAEHAFFECPVFSTTCRISPDDIQLNADNVIKYMLENQENWNAVKMMAAVIMKELRRREKSRILEQHLEPTWLYPHREVELQSHIPRERNWPLLLYFHIILYCYPYLLYVQIYSSIFYQIKKK